MEKKKLDWIISIIKEQIVTASTAGSPGFSGSADPKGPTAGFDPVMGKIQRRFMKGKRKPWLDYLKNK